jgi:hypothetical protein
MAGPGATPKLTPAVHEAICKAIAGGNTLRHAAAVAGIAPSTLRAWKARGREEEEGPYAAFLAATVLAEAQCIAEMVAVIEQSAKTDRNYKAAQWWLAVRVRDTYGQDAKELKELASQVKQLTNDIRELREQRANSASPT